MATKKMTTTQGKLCKNHCAALIGQLKNQDTFKKNHPNLWINFSIEKFIHSEKGIIYSSGYLVNQPHSSLNSKNIIVIRIMLIQLNVLVLRISALIGFSFLVNFPLLLKQQQNSEPLPSQSFFHHCQQPLHRVISSKVN